MNLFYRFQIQIEGEIQDDLEIKHFFLMWFDLMLVISIYNKFYIQWQKLIMNNDNCIVITNRNSDYYF